MLGVVFLMEYGIEILKTKYYSLKEKWMKAEEEMNESPNQYSAQQLDFFYPKMEQVKECLKKLGVEVS